MKKKLYLLSLLIVTLVGITSIFVGLLLSSYKFSNVEHSNSAEPYPLYYVPYSITNGPVSSYKKCEVTLDSINPENEIIEFTIEGGSLKKGDYCNKGTKINDYTIQTTGRVFDIVSNGTTDNVKMINYENRKFIIYVNSYDLKFFKYGSEHIIKFGDESCRAYVTFIDQLLEESTRDSVKVELEINCDSLIDNYDLFLLLKSNAVIYYDEIVVDKTLRCFKSAFQESELIKGNLVNVVVKKASTSEYITLFVEIGLIGDSYVQILSEDIEEGDVICV